ncbi:MAG: hypothetical protein KJZ69_03120 [Phycisphaerales bacterium]|nr:hypothetical protein [Phycisphaerales bacterium]
MNQSDDQPLPPMSEALLDDEQLAALFDDLRRLVRIDGIVIKAGRGRADDTARPQRLEEAHAMLAQRMVRGVQIRYRYDGAAWCDTLMPVAQGIRLVRIRHD